MYLPVLNIVLPQKKLFPILLLLICVTVSTLSGQSAETFRSAAQSALDAFDTPGFAIGVIKDGEVVLSEGFGVRQEYREEKVDGNTLFAIASNTKAFIATAIAKLDAEGQLDLDDPVQKYLPYFQLYDEYVSQHTTVRDLLCHRVGLGTFSGDAIWYKSEKSAEEIIRQIRYLPQAYPWRAGYGYTNLMFITAGEVIRSVTGMGWDEYVRAHFLQPLGMERTQTSVMPLKKMDNVATPHVTNRDNQPLKMAPWEASGAAGGIISSTDDMLRWLNAQLSSGMVEEEEIFPAAARAECMKPHNATGGELTLSAIGLGWFLSEREGSTVVTHGGGYDGMYSRVIMIPDQGVGIVVLTNSMTGLSSALGNYVRDTYLGIDTDGWLDQAIRREANNRQAWRNKFLDGETSHLRNTSPTVPTDSLAATYYDPLYGEITVAIDDSGDPVLSFEGAPALTATLTHWHYDTWRIDWREPHAWFDFGTVQFLMDNNQQPRALRFEVPNDDIFFEEIEAVRRKD